MTGRPPKMNRLSFVIVLQWMNSRGVICTSYWMRIKERNGAQQGFLGWTAERCNVWSAGICFVLLPTRSLRRTSIRRSRRAQRKKICDGRTNSGGEYPAHEESLAVVRGSTYSGGRAGPRPGNSHRSANRERKRFGAIA